MSIEITNQTETVRKKSLFKRWWLWLLVLIGVVVIIGALASSNPKPLELSDLSGESKESAIAKLGKPDKSWIVRDDEDGFYYMYPFGVTLFGNGNLVSEISLTYAEDGAKSNKKYSILGMTLGMNFNDYTKENPDVFRAPNLDLVSPEGQRSRMYHDMQEDTILNLLTESDRIVGVRYVHYTNSDESNAVDLANYIGNIKPEQLMGELGVTSTITGNAENTYYFGQANKANWVKSDTANGQIREITITDGRFFNIGGQRVGDTAEQAAAALGTPISTTEEADGVTVSTFKYSAPNTLNDCIVEVRSSNGKIVSIQATLQSTLADSLLPSVEERESAPVTEKSSDTPTDTWPTLSLEQQIEFNQYFSEFSAVNFGTSPYIKDSAISSYSADELIRFAIERNLKFGQDNSYSFDPKNDNELIMHQDLVAEVIEQFFGIQINHKSISGYKYKDGFYRWDAYRWVYTDSNLFSQVQRLLDNQDGTLTGEIGVYQDLNDYGFFNNEDPNNLQAKAIRYQPQTAWSDASNFSYIGTVKATIKQSDSKSWIVTDYKVESMY
ncbi:hypothetical protein [Paenibacillus thalictri]|uniref:Uncharacterized protein n=1 Tax=Paenibacillus thalictri TaxID=2527873 RepID=A0A4V6MSI9_9BACL|nr:hypothetical protein [Paenibacillus thalictri]TBL80872.1 hypothetical protein EYB31_06550 [Paenibacillus thalictri]